MKLILFLFGVWFAYWNFLGMNENVRAFYHYLGLTATAVLLGVWAFVELFRWLTAPTAASRSQSSGDERVIITIVVIRNEKR
jgi:hypothetical protein